MHFLNFISSFREASTIPLIPIPSFLPKIKPSINYLITTGLIKDITEEMEQHSNAKPCYGRAKDIKWIANRMASVEKNGALIVGSAGVGKTLIIYHIAYLITRNQAPLGLKNKRIFLIQKNSLSIFETISKCYTNHCILVSDEAHSLFQQTEETFWSNKLSVEDLKPYIGNGRVAFLGFTDRPYDILKDNAWKRRLYERRITEMSIADAISALDESKKYFENSLRKKIKDSYPHLQTIPQIILNKEAIDLAVKLSTAYIPDEFLPDKAYKILEPACIQKITTFIEQNQKESPDPIFIEASDVSQQTQEDYHISNIELTAKLQEIELNLAQAIIPSSESLAYYTTNLTLLASRGQLQPVYGREQEIQNALAILGGIESNNMILKGPAGCGKTRIAEGIAYKIIQGQVPIALKNKQVLLLNLSSLLGNTKFRGELEEKIDQFLKSAKKYEGTFILVIDEIHRLMRAGRSSENHYDVANEFKEILARGKLPTLGMTTDGEFSILNFDPAFLRRFQVQQIKEFSANQTIEALKSDCPHFEESYSKKIKRPFKIEDAACEAAAYLAVHYLPKEYQPSSGYKLFHAACAFKTAQIDEKKLETPIFFKEEDVLKYINQFYTDQRNDHSFSFIPKRLAELKAELHPSNQLIPYYEPLIQLCDNLTTQARQRTLKPSTHREEIIQQMITFLSYPTINNLIIKGKAGVGKTTLVQELAHRMAHNQVPIFLQNKYLLSLRINDLIDSSQKSTQALTSFLESAKKYTGHYILFVDEIHILFQVSINGVPLFELLKPILAEGKLRLIGATTEEEYKKFIEVKGPAISRRFQQVELPELTISQSIDVLLATKSFYENSYSKQFNYRFTIDTEAITEIVTTAKHFFSNQALPASAFNLLEEYCAEKCMANEKVAQNSPSSLLLPLVKLSKEDVQLHQNKFPPTLITWRENLFKLCLRICNIVMKIFHRFLIKKS
jgi:ATP-dependent Clp protease ATP-binding subunit ClpA